MYLAAAKVANMPLALKTKHLKRSQLELLAKVMGELDEKPEVTINVMQTQEFIAARTIIFDELEDYSEIRKLISYRLRGLANTGHDPGHAAALAAHPKNESGLYHLPKRNQSATG
jgi:hypothetical protein